ncbi:MAG: hypothetical protein JO069_01580 [Verrucomicrobia bacterium]|nr:hypothetical protein [Verrucomicrobiota bacterium]
MNPEPRTPSPERRALNAEPCIPGQRWAYGLMAGFTALMACVTGTVIWDRRHRSELEVVSQPTAVGDPVTVRYDPKQNPAKEILKWNGEPYFLQTNQVFKFPDQEVLKLARDDSGQIQLYRSAHDPEDRIVLAKIQPNTYLKLTTR